MRESACVSVKPVTEAPVRLTFALVGFSKCGTTTLSAAMQRHPEVLLPVHKEPWFFCDPDFADDWPKLQALLPRWEQYAAVGDDSTAYASLRHGSATAARLADLYPDMKILIIARDPIDRIESAYRQMQHTGHHWGLVVPGTLEQTFAELPQLINDSKYWQCSQPYRDLFPAEQLKVVFLEDLRNDHNRVLAECLEFVGVSAVDDATEPISRLNSGDDRWRDSALLRRLRVWPMTRQWVAYRATHEQELLLRRLRLRRPSNRRVEWSAAARETVREQVIADAERFLEAYGRPGMWPRMDSWK